jgi:predicted ATPase
MCSVNQRLEQSLQAAEALYHRLVLLVGEAGAGKSSLLRQLAAIRGTEVINLNLKLSAELLELTPTQRALRVPQLLRRIADQAPPLLILDNIELLFDKDLQLDPLRLLEGLSRNRVVLAAWNGRLHAGRLDYAEPGHPEYRRYDSIDALIVGMDGSATIDTDT